MARVLFHVQHLLGIGHVRRASLVAEVMARKGMDVHVVLGGAPVAGVMFAGCTCHRLPEASAADASFSQLVDSTGAPVDDGWRNTRRNRLLVLYTDLAPDVLFIEQFPFGRRQFRFELLPLLDLACASTARPLVACSVRDILVTRNDPHKIRQTVSYIGQYFDAVIVHGDPEFVPFEATFPEATRFAEKIHYSGYVAPPENTDSGDAGYDEVIVAAGGGAVGAELMICAAHAKSDSILSHLTWRFLCGPNLPQDVIHKIRQLNDPGIIVEANRSDYGTLLRNCRLSISQGGYNTMMDLIRAHCPAIIVPFGSGGEDEQSRRTTILHDLGYVTMIAADCLSGDTLTTGIEHAMSQKRHHKAPFPLNGAGRTAEIIGHEHLFAKS